MDELLCSLDGHLRALERALACAIARAFRGHLDASARLRLDLSDLRAALADH